MESKLTLYYAYDPMCSWCWGFAPTWEKLANHVTTQYGDRLETVKLLGGLAPDTDEPMPDSMQLYLRSTWRKIEKQIPGTRFNFDFWDRCAPRRSTWPACRAVIAARKQADQFEEKMSGAIQRGYYLEARNPSRRDTLEAMAEEIGLDKRRFSNDLDSAETQDEHQKEMRLTRRLGIQGFPSLALVKDRTAFGVLLDYNGVEKTVEHLERLVP